MDDQQPMVPIQVSITYLAAIRCLLYCKDKKHMEDKNIKSPIKWTLGTVLKLLAFFLGTGRTGHPARMQEICRDQWWCYCCSATGYWTHS